MGDEYTREEVLEIIERLTKEENSKIDKKILEKELEHLEVTVDDYSSDMKEIREKLNKIHTAQELACSKIDQIKECVDENDKRIAKVKDSYLGCEARQMAEMGMFDKLRRDTGLMLIETGIIGTMLTVATLIMRVVGIV